MNRFFGAEEVRTYREGKSEVVVLKDYVTLENYEMIIPDNGTCYSRDEKTKVHELLGDFLIQEDKQVALYNPSLDFKKYFITQNFQSN